MEVFDYLDNYIKPGENFEIYLQQFLLQFIIF